MPKPVAPTPQAFAGQLIMYSAPFLFLLFQKFDFSLCLSRKPSHCAPTVHCCFLLFPRESLLLNWFFAVSDMLTMSAKIGLHAWSPVMYMYSVKFNVF